MRPIERIEVFIKILMEEKNHPIHKMFLKYYPTTFEEKIEKLKEIWLRNPDWRFTQLLHNVPTKFDPNIAYYYSEDYDIFPDRKNELLFWGTYGKDGKGPFRRVAIKDMETDHIKNVLKIQGVDTTLEFEMNKELYRRNETS